MDQYFCRICSQELKSNNITALCKKCSSRENIKKSLRRIDIVGKRFGLLVVQSYSHTKKNEAYWICNCDCGNRRVALGKVLKKGLIYSCSCVRADPNKNLIKRHPQSKTYKTWTQMKARCYNSKTDGYKNYGGRGISVCERWRQSFKDFLADMGLKPDGKSLDRIDNNGNYCKENCRWATKKEQQNNLRKSVFIEAFGKRQTMAQWADETGISVNKIRSRVRSGWAPNDILTKK